MKNPHIKFRPRIATDNTNLTLDGVRAYIISMPKKQLDRFLEVVYQSYFGAEYGRWDSIGNEYAFEWLFTGKYPILKWDQEKQWAEINKT